MEVSTIASFKTIQNRQTNNQRTERPYTGNQLNNIKNNNSPNFGWFGIDDLFCWGARKLNKNRERLRQEQIENVYKKVGNDIELVAKRFGIPKETAAAKYQEDLNIGGLEHNGDGHEKGLNKVIGYSLEKLEMIKKVVVPILKSKEAKMAGKELPSDVVLPNGVLIYGERGTGKSHMADSLMEHLKEKGIDTVTINKPWYKGDTDENIFAIWDTFEAAQNNAKQKGKHTVIQINNLDQIMEHPDADLLKTEIAFQTQHPAQDGVTWIATTNDKEKLPDWVFDKNRTSIIMPLGEMKSDAETSAVLSHFIAKTNRRDKTDHDVILDYIDKKGIQRVPGRIKEIVEKVNSNLYKKDYWGQSRTFDSWNIGYHTESVKDKDMKKAIDEIKKKLDKEIQQQNLNSFNSTKFENQ